MKDETGKRKRSPSSGEKEPSKRRRTERGDQQRASSPSSAGSLDVARAGVTGMDGRPRREGVVGGVAHLSERVIASWGEKPQQLSPDEASSRMKTTTPEMPSESADFQETTHSAEKTDSLEKPTSKFRIGHMNSIESIRNLQSINGITIENLEARMRPSCDSGAGFLGSNESLREVLIKDTKTVTEMGLTHQEMAEFLRLFSKEQKGRSEHNGKEYFRYFIQWRGYQVSPFRDGTNASADHTVINLENGARIKFSELLPEMIDRYGFYEGKTSYRLDPMEIARVMGITPIQPDVPIDPILQLIKNRDASVVIQTVAQLKEVNILYDLAEIDVLSGKNYKIIPQDLEAEKQHKELIESIERAKTIDESESE